MAAADVCNHHDDGDSGDKEENGPAGVEAAVQWIVTEEVAVRLVVKWVMVFFVMEWVIKHCSFECVEGFVVHMNEWIAVVRLFWMSVCKAIQ